MNYRAVGSIVLFSLFLLCSCTHQYVREQNSTAGQNNLRSKQPANTSAFYRDLLSQINQYRARNGLKSLSFDSKLAAIAKVHCAHMKGRNSISHDNFEQRFERSRHTSCVENVATGYLKPRELFEAWRHSAGHNKNMLSKDIRLAGISMDGSYVTFFACDARARAYSKGEKITYKTHSES